MRGMQPALAVWIAAAAACATGGTEAPCDPGLDDCGGLCTSLDTDPNHCGVCGHACAPGQRCTGGTCVAACPDGQANCGGVCRDLRSDPAHCGLCGNACGADQVCTAGACLLACGAGLTPCGSTCRDLTADPAHCGACGHACSAGQACVASTCVPDCDDGRTDCGGLCVDLRSDPAHCGGCDLACDPGELCEAAVCLPDCGSLARCGDVCRDTTTDPEHCGACGHACADGETCAASTCLPACSAGLRWCAGACVDPLTNPEHCGACGTRCDAGTACLAGSCSSVVPRSCLEALDLGIAPADGPLTIDPDGPGPQPARTVWCDQTTDGGGWMLTYKVRSNIDASSNPWWNQVMPGAGTTLPTDLAAPAASSDGPTAAVRAALTALVGAVEWRAQTRRGSTPLFDVATRSTADDGRGLRCFATGTCSSATQTCSPAATDGRVLLNSLGGPLPAGSTGYVCDVGWTDCDFCVDWSEIRLDPTAGGSPDQAVRYVGDSAISLTDTFTCYFVR